MSRQISIKGTNTTTTSSFTNSGVHKSTVAMVHTPFTNNELSRSGLLSLSEAVQRVRSVSNGRSPEGLKMAKYSGTFIHGDTTKVPLEQSKYHIISRTNRKYFLYSLRRFKLF